jgi:hypothetical protein
MFKPCKRLLLLCFVTTALSAPAYADENPAIVDLLLKNIERQTQIKPTFESAEEDSDGNVTISNMSFKPAAGDTVMTVEEVSLEDVSDPEDGMTTIGSATFSGIKIESKSADGKPVTVEMPEGSVEEWYVKDAGDAPTPLDAVRASMTIAKKMSSGKVSITSDGQTVTSDGYEATWDGDPATGSGTWDAKVSSVVIPAALVALADPSGTMKNLGYGDLTFSMTGGGKTTIDADNMGMDFNFTLAGKDMAAIKVAMNADKIPLAVYAELQKAQANGKEPDMQAFMPQIQGISFGGFSLRFEDASITPKLLPMIAAMSGMGTQEQLVANAGAMAQVGLMQLNNPEFTNQVVGAINTFMKEPKSFTITLKPTAPVTVQQLSTMNPSDPGAAIKTLGVSVTAND